MVATHEAERFEAPVFHRFEGVTEIGNYAPLPDGWWLAVADIVDSTGAIDAGRYKDVNMAGASVISGVLNALGRDDLPFVFGGDGALVALPPSGAAAATQALASTRRWTLEQLGLSMRAAMVPVTAAREAGQDVRVARFRPSEFVTYAMFAGGGASWAERQMKAGRFSVDLAPIGEKPDLTGLSCRWNPIRSRHGVIASIIAVPDEAAADSDFRGLVGDILGLAGGAERAGHPVPEDGPAPGLSHAGMMLELKADRLPGQPHNATDRRASNHSETFPLSVPRSVPEIPNLPGFVHLLRDLLPGSDRPLSAEKSSDSSAPAESSGWHDDRANDPPVPASHGPQAPWNGSIF